MVIVRVLMNIYSASLESSMSHFSVQSKVPELRMFGKPAIMVLYQVLKVVTNGYSTRSRSYKVSCTSGKESGERTGHVAFSSELIDGSTT